ncbi:hypothetical protein [Nostoc sp.]|uniref:hypothetical protein n=1 Tax=Nostoc sp. TaxID=1180 RepID=UPI002FFA1CD8
MSTIGLHNVEMSTSGLQILPTNERQVRPLVALEPEVQPTAWQQAVQVAGGKVPTGRIVKDVVHSASWSEPKYLIPTKLAKSAKSLPKITPNSGVRVAAGG